MSIMGFLKRNTTNILLVVLILLFLGTLAGQRLAMSSIYSQSRLGGSGLASADGSSYGLKETTVYMTMKIPYGTLDEKKNAIENEARKLGGIVLDEYFTYGEASSSDTIIMKIPHQRADEFERSVKKYGKIVSLSRNTVDITKQYSFKKQRLERLIDYREKLLEMYRNASLSEMMNINRELKDVEEEIDYLSSEVSRYDEGMEYDRYRITLEENKHPLKNVFTSASELARLFTSSINVGMIVVVAVSGFVIPFLPLIGIYLLIKKLLKS